MYNKDKIDKEAEREAAALQKQGKYSNDNYRRTRLESDNYNKQLFDKLFKD
jgi:hypothetical protein